MHLTDQELTNKAQWEDAGIVLPRFDRAAMIAATAAAPTWVHFGAGNIFRAFPAALQQQLLDEGIESKGIIVVEGYDYEIIDRMCLPHDNLSLLVTLKSDGAIEKTVIGSIALALRADSGNAADFGRLKEIFRAPSLQMVSFTITEKGYSLVRSNGEYLPDVAEDFQNGPAAPKSYIGKLAALCYERYRNAAPPLALVSMDNCSHNGTKLYEAVHAFAEQWTQNGLADRGFLAYIEDPSRVSFPWSMIDKITPRPDDSVKAMLEAIGFEDTAGEVTAKNTYVAPFVNAEEAQYLVIEDAFPAGRPALEKAGVIFTTRETVDKVEKMKVCTCLNPLHTALAIFGCLLGYTKISAEMKDADLVKLVEAVGYREGLPVVVDPDIIAPAAFIDEVLKVRVPNPFMPDTPQRIATDTSQKLPIRFGETIKAYLASDTLKVSDLKFIPLVLAGWVRYLLGIDDAGKEFTVSPDPMYDTLAPLLAGVKLGQGGPFHAVLEPILSNEKIFAVNLYEAGLGQTVEDYFAELMAGPGAVRATLHRHLANG
ncbi:fructuronate reductase [Hydrogenispora ethanolica]|uniref:Fructuronate reductase n=1 Tax=Hydrogenispora ethanolica TaxID=1082276 RepID=A0A4R1S0E8_HYDET|nr:mannitol dehydrogenase family protein [Hydrogenispora ethanolica]TCL72389.1 fructuronate reductase [Hydrogenispora ethanolica]